LSLFLLSLASLDLLKAKAFLFHQLCWWLFYAEANNATGQHEQIMLACFY